MYGRVLCRVKNVFLCTYISALRTEPHLLSCSLTPLKRSTCDRGQNPWQKSWSKLNCPTSITVTLSSRETLPRVYLQRDAAVQ